MNAVTLITPKKGSVKSYFNGTYLNADLETEDPWGWTPAYYTYAKWLDVSIDIGQGEEGFKLRKDKTVAFRDNGWVGTCVDVIPRFVWSLTMETDHGIGKLVIGSMDRNCFGKLCTPSSRCHARARGLSSKWSIFEVGRSMEGR
jgi:hypothetical protein